MDPKLFLGSLAAILVLAGIARWLGLGHVPRLVDEAQARLAAQEAVDDFDPVRVGLDRQGAGALMEDRNGRLLLLRPHGNFFAGRIGNAAWHATLSGEHLTIDSGERRFGAITLELDDPAYWVDAIERLRIADNA